MYIHTLKCLGFKAIKYTMEDIIIWETEKEI